MSRSLSHTHLTTKLQQTWLLRWNQRIDESLTALADIQHETGWHRLEPDQLKAFESAQEKEIFIEALLLKASLLRAQGQLQKASSWLRRIVMIHDQMFETRGFRILFEVGMDHWVHEDTAQAMESFYLAERKARNPTEKYFSLFNLLLCLEAIDLPREQVEEKLALVLQKNQSLSEFRHLHEQWKAYQLRKLFYSQLKLAKLSDLSGQAAFFKSWVMALPYFSSDWKERAHFDLDANYVWQGAYRSRTLMGVWLPADLEVSRVTDAVDRLYLWTWWWMADHAQISTEKIIWTLESIVNTLNTDTESRDVLLLLRNALSWIVLIEPRLESRVAKLLKTLKKHSSPRYQVLEVEFGLIQALIHDPNDWIQKHLKGFVCFEKILKEVKGSAKEVLLPRLMRRLRPFQTEEAQACKLVVDLATSEIKVLESFQVLKSQSLANLLSLLHESGRARFADFMPESEEELDTQKVYNLVARARKLTGQRTLMIRGEEVLRGPGWPRVMVLHEGLPDHAMSEATAQKISSLPESASHLQAARALLPSGFGRREMEKTLRVSKSTACRMIEKWIEDGLIEGIGRAKAKRYQWIK